MPHQRAETMNLMLPRHAHKRNLQAWLQHHLPIIHALLEAHSGALSKQMEVWARLRNAMRLDADALGLPCEESLYADVYATLQANYKRLLGVSMDCMLDICGYDGVTSRRHNSVWSTSYDMHNENRRLFGKRMLTYDDSGYPNMMGTVLNEIMVSRQCTSPRITDAQDVVICGSTNPLLAAATVTIVQTRRVHDLSKALRKSLVAVQPQDACLCLMQITEGLAQLHDQQILHLDVKPNNVLVSGGGLLLCDFGLSVRVTTQRVLEARKVTSWYRPPELLAACVDAPLDVQVLHEFDESVDMWSLGALFWDVLCVRPMMADVNTSDAENSEDLLRLLWKQVELLGTPTEAEILDWRCSATQFHIVCPLPKHPRGRFATHAQTLMRPHVRKWPAQFTADLVALTEELLSWRPRQRPSASLVWSRLRLMAEKLPVQTTWPEFRLPTRFQVSAEEVQWRRAVVTREEVESWWRRSQRVLEVASQAVRVRHVSTVATFDMDPDAYLDAIILSCELMMRLRFGHGDGACIYSDETLHMGCISIAVQLTRPWWPVRVVYDQYRNSVLEHQQLELYIAYSLRFQLYAENYLTEAQRRAPFQRLAFARVHDGYMAEFQE